MFTLILIKGTIYPLQKKLDYPRAIPIVLPRTFFTPDSLCDQRLGHAVLYFLHHPLRFRPQNPPRGVLGHEHGIRRSGPMFSGLHAAMLTLQSYILFLVAFLWPTLVAGKHIKKISACP